MARFLNSFQLRLYAILAGLSLLLLTFTFIGVRTTAEIDQRIGQMKLVSDQRATAYLLVSQARHFAYSRQEIVLSNLGNAILDSVEMFDSNQTALRDGDPEKNLPPLHEDAMIAIFSKMDREWTIYRAALEALLVGNRANFQEQVQILVDIDKQSTAVYTLADQLTEAFDAETKTQQRYFQDGIRIMAVTALAVVAAAIAFIIQMVHSFNALTKVASAFTEGHFEVRASTSNLTEMNQIGETLNEMASQVGLLIETLEERALMEIAARERAERADQVKSAFLAAMSHELRTPLNAIINFTKFVVKGVMGPVNERQVETLNKVADSGKHLLNLINDILDISKIESGSLNLFIEDDVDMKQIIASAAATGESLLAGKPVTLQCDVDPDLPLMWGDKQRILQILLNIVSNACKFTDEGTIKISAHRRGDEMHLSVEDTGPGIAVEDYATVFQSFKQTSTGLRKGSGTGLGMPISRSLAEAHGGRLWLKSEVGKGSTFFVVLPLKSETLELTLAS